MARPREPIDLIVAKGRKHLTKVEYARRKSTEVTVAADNIKAPDFLTKKEKELFYDLAKQLIETKIMTNLDCDALARYINARNEYIKITKELRKIKFTLDKKSTATPEAQLIEQYSKYNFLSKIQIRFAKTSNDLGRELGLTALSRCRLTIQKEEQEKPINKFMKHAQ